MGGVDCGVVSTGAAGSSCAAVTEEFSVGGRPSDVVDVQALKEITAVEHANIAVLARRIEPLLFEVSALVKLAFTPSMLGYRR